MKENLKWEDNKLPVKIGRMGENEYTQVVVDCSVVFSEFPSAIPAVTIRPPSGDAYPAIATRDGDNVVWVVNDSDLAQQGFGEMQLTFTSDNVVVKSCIWRTTISKSLTPTGEAPTPVEDWLVEANTALNAIPQTIDDALQEAKDSGEFDGDPGQDGFSPTITVTDITGGHRVTITDATGSRTVDVMDGEHGEPGEPGSDGVSPIVVVSPITDGHRVTITDKTGAHSFDVMDGEKGDPGTPGDPTTLIDDTSITATNKVWSAKKSADEVSDLKSAISQKYEKPSGGIPASDLASGVIPAVPVTDVQVNGVSVLSQGVANVPVASDSAFGAVKVGTGLKIVATDNTLRPNTATVAQAKAGTASYYPITPLVQDASTFYGLAKASGDTSQSSSSNPVGTYTDAAKKAIRKMLGIPNQTWEKIGEYTVAEDTALFEITTDSNGQPFKLSQMLVKVWLEASTTGTRDYIAANNLVTRTDDVNGAVSAPTKRYLLNTGAACYMQFETWVKAGNVVSNGFVASTAGSTQTIEQINYTQDNIKCFRGFRLSQYTSGQTLVPAGTVVNLYGIRIDE